MPFGKTPFQRETEMAAAQLLLILLCRAQNLRMDPSGRTALNQERPLSLKN
jgi:hypothetical protein